MVLGKLVRRPVVLGMVSGILGSVVRQPVVLGSAASVISALASPCTSCTRPGRRTGLLLRAQGLGNFDCQKLCPERLFRHDERLRSGRHGRDIQKRLGSHHERLSIGISRQDDRKRHRIGLQKGLRSRVRTCQEGDIHFRHILSPQKFVIRDGLRRRHCRDIIQERLSRLCYGLVLICRHVHGEIFGQQLQAAGVIIRLRIRILRHRLITLQQGGFFL